MSDTLMRCIGADPASLTRLIVFDPVTNKNQRVMTGQSWPYLWKMCEHANKQRVAFVGRAELMESTGLNGQSIQTFTRRFILAGIFTYIGKTSYLGSAPINTYLIDLPGLESLEDELSADEIREKAKKVRSSKKNSRAALMPALNNVLEDALVPALEHDLPVRHKQELEPELQLQLEQVFDKYVDLKQRNQKVEIRNDKAWREGVKKNALKEIAPRGETYKDRAVELLKQGYRAEDIAGFLADGCVNGQGITFWDKRPEFFDESDISKLGPVNFGQTEDDLDFSF